MRASEQFTKTVMKLGWIELVISFAMTVGGLVTWFTWSSPAMKFTATMIVLDFVIKVIEFRLGMVTARDGDMNFDF